MIRKTLLSISIVAVLAISLLGRIASAEIPNPTGDIYVQDTANVLTQEEKTELINLGRQVDDQTKAQVAVLTVSTLNGQDIESYANAAFRKFKLGNKELNNGVLLLLVIGKKKEDRKIRVEVGYGLEGALPDGKVGRILDRYALPYLKDNKADLAIVNTYKQLLNEVANEYNIKDVAKAEPYQQESSFSTWKVILIAIGIIILIIIDMKFFGGALTYVLINLLSSILRNGGGGSGGNRGGGGGSSGGGGASRNW
ncbi:TPM domain-containing protein [Bacillus sporothermodurans]|uniref:TPM domain-containing protein n=1 Tax=Heyndrickxia sporothermodurans TaxID=46224 RepID=UPI00192C95A9|nr:TPM domain-containing protein [Heyndrickxia sporothermodurans]MBL5799944.1 TPM domain-containing protein [Heyndrickxia sporothermodurans]MBL5810999.1 TPM domain-containing protein [Heyndrickxia sporothermodurans]MBL5814566.1 TPM domain-containing protein [Heyndrickxia sporothermodurans]MBL5817940.1 TPM domain-containing protein [Heyndrickxia sporothermodurans]MBL5843079.1 TPM domain-containing protein [Heyndrickxia sporothermodurans]